MTSDQTIVRYRARTAQLLSDYWMMCPAPPSRYGFAQYLVGRKPGLMASTWRQYKASVISTLEAEVASLAADVDGRGSGTSAPIEDGTRAIALLRATDQSGSLATSTRTSAIKSKRLPEADRVLLQEAALNAKSVWGLPLYHYLAASVRAGLRPCEWATSELSSDGCGSFVLRVRNAKWDEVRAHGEFRTLTFTTLNREDESSLIEWHRHAIEMQRHEAYDLLMEGVGNLLRDLDDCLWGPNGGKNFTLYSARHEFGAIAKSALPADEVAALMGHASDRTAVTHYGRPRRSSGGVICESDSDVGALPRPDPAEVARVRAKRAEKIARLAQFGRAANPSMGP